MKKRLLYGDGNNNSQNKKIGKPWKLSDANKINISTDLGKNNPNSNGTKSKDNSDFLDLEN